MSIRYVCIFILFATMPISATARHPNVVLILADDFGVGDIQAHYPDNKIATPYLDRLVGQGTSFTDAHSPSAVCSPTRYGLLTGRYAWRTPLQEWVIAAYEPPLIEASRLTLPEFLRQHGYVTACVGKWHLGWNWPGDAPSRMTPQRNGQWRQAWDFTKPIPGGPVDRGFDYFFGVDLPNLPPFTFIRQDRVATQPTDRYQWDPTEGVNLPKGFEGAPMAPGFRLGEILPAITRDAAEQVRKLARGESPFFLFFSMTSPHEPVVPTAKFRGKSEIAPIADFVMETDWSAGQILDALQEAGVAEETIVIFTADNGHSHYTGWQSLVDAGHLPSGPYRGHKGDIWEGGHRVPLIVRWPDRIPAGEQRDQLVCLTDIFATLADVVGADLPGTNAEDSLSFLPALETVAPSVTRRERRKSLISHSNHGEFAYREGPWKIVFRNVGKLDPSRGKPRVVELYHLEHDVAEQHDVAADHPDVVAKLSDALQSVVDAGGSRADVVAKNDTHVQFRRTQQQRWQP